MRRRGFLLAAGMLAALPARAEPRAMVDAVIALATAPDALSLDPEALLQRLAFRGGKATRAETATGVTLTISDGPLTFGRLALSKKGDVWQVDRITLLFAEDDAVTLVPLQAALTKTFGGPQDTTTGNTVLLWRGQDRVIQVTADVPAEAKKLVYAVIIVRR